jgi:REP element-mobilizing transposase RayT
MPNHVHALIEVFAGHPTHSVVQRWKAFSARQTNVLLGRTGTLWQTDFYDRFIRDEGHYATAVDYIERNPVKARLAAQPKEWPFSSARFRTV